MTAVGFRRALLLGLALFLGAPRAPAQAVDGFAIDRFEPAERGSVWFVADSLDFRGHGRLLLGATGDWAHKPLVVYDPSGGQPAPLVRNQFLSHFGASLLLWERLRIGLSLPVLIHQSGDEVTLGGTAFGIRPGGALGDFRTSLDYRLFGFHRQVLTLAVGLQAFFPTGDPRALAGDREFRLGPRLLIAGASGKAEYAARVSVLRRSDRGRFAGAITGSELQFVAALGMRTAGGNVIVGPELYGSTVVDDADAFLAGPSTPLELLFGVHFNPTPDVRVGGGLGPGLTRGFGSPVFRGAVSLEWAPDPNRPARPKRRAARAPDYEELASYDDRDGDGIVDEEDACPEVQGAAHDDPRRSGCSKADRDLDAVPDEEDACPDERGKRSLDPETNGCMPPKDRDKDGFVDVADACPDVPGASHIDPKTNGCPVARIEAGAIKILERVEFELSSDKLRPESERVLKAVLDLLHRHPELTKISVEGHTDNRGPIERNRRLSELRARSVVKWLVERGVDGKRLGSKGLGADRPVDSNETERGRQSNRRVEFRIVENEGKLTKGTPSDPGF